MNIYECIFSELHHSLIIFQETSSQSSGSSLSVAVIVGGIAGGVVVIGAIAGLVYYLKTRVPSGKVSQDSSAVKSIS